MTITIKPWQQVFVVAMNVMRSDVDKNSKLYQMSKEFLDRWQATENKDEMYLTDEEMDYFFERAN